MRDQFGGIPRNHGLLVVMAVFIVMACLFLFFVGHDAIKGMNEYQFFADSSTYHDVFENFNSGDGSELVGVASNYIGPLLILKLSFGNIYLVMLLNSILYFLSIRIISTYLGINSFLLGILLLCNPLTISSLLSVNKEIFIYPFFAYSLAGMRSKSKLDIGIALVFSILVRWQVTLFYLVSLCIYSTNFAIKRRWQTLLVVLVGLSALYYFLLDFLDPVVSVAELSVNNYSEGGSGLWEALLNLQKAGYYFLIFPIKAAHLLFGLAFKVLQIFSFKDFYNDVVVVLYSAVSLCIFLILVYKKKTRLDSDLFYLSILYLAIFSLTPIYSPRYLYPVPVAWAMILCHAPESISTTCTKEDEIVDPSPCRVMI